VIPTPPPPLSLSLSHTHAHTYTLSPSLLFATQKINKGFAIVNEKKHPHPWDTHYQFSIKTLLSNGPDVRDVNVCSPYPPLAIIRLPMLSCLLNFGLDNLWLFVKKKTFWTEAPYGMRESTKSAVRGWLVICEWSRTHICAHGEIGEIETSLKRFLWFVVKHTNMYIAYVYQHIKLTNVCITRAL